MQVIIPMSGVGQRFIDAGYIKPKPLIEVEGNPMIEYVVNLFDVEDEFIFICNEKHIRVTDLENVLKSIAPSAHVVITESKKKGPVYAVMQAKEFINDDQPVVVTYCDFNQVWNYRQFVEMTKNMAIDGSIPCYTGFHPHLLGPNKYASCDIDDDGYVKEIREKYSFTEDKMDCPQSSGIYYFKSGKMMKYYFEKYMSESEGMNGEYYVSLVYNLMIADGLKVNIFPVDMFCQWGTPQDLEEFNYFTKIFHK